MLAWKRRVWQSSLKQCTTCSRRLVQTSTSLSRGDVVSGLAKRGLLQQCSSPNLSAFLASTRTTVYTGLDPTATSLHVGNLLPLIALLYFQAQGHQTIALVGGATGSIGDPSGRSTERNALDPETLRNNVKAIDRQLCKVFENARKYMEKRGAHGVTESEIRPVKVLNNFDWFRDIGVLEFLSDVGRLARVSVMLSRESVRSRLDSPEGISFTEFSYQLLQAYDFYYLFLKERCRVQIGGSDQWGNIMAGMDVIKRKTGRPEMQAIDSDIERDPAAFGLTIPLVTTATGEKFGKSAGNAVWLDENLVSHYDFYQFFRRTPDSEVQKYLRYFTFLREEDIEKLMVQHTVTPEKHIPQRTLAREVTELVHGDEAAYKAQIMAEVLFDGNLAETRGIDVLAAFSGDDRLAELRRTAVIGTDIVQVALACGAVKSKSAGRKLLASGGLYLNNVKVSPSGKVLEEEDLLDGVIILIRTGKSNHRVVKVV
ncbi:tyrosine---tRNA ligase [Spizellomyces sp. 'palustris']|nr:tyrosine---tRNA ligase [Spizellomyces sp. 'palustris']